MVDSLTCLLLGSSNSALKLGSHDRYLNVTAAKPFAFKNAIDDEEIEETLQDMTLGIRRMTNNGNFSVAMFVILGMIRSISRRFLEDASTATAGAAKVHFSKVPCSSSTTEEHLNTTTEPSLRYIIRLATVLVLQ